jgi:hypothetical protein
MIFKKLIINFSHSPRGESERRVHHQRREHEAEGDGGAPGVDVPQEVLHPADLPRGEHLLPYFAEGDGGAPGVDVPQEVHHPPDLPRGEQQLPYFAVLRHNVA